MVFRLNIILCVLFGLILIAPLTVTVLDVEVAEPLEENRLMEALPRVEDCEVTQIDDCFRKYNNWFDDNHGARDLLIRLQTQIDYSVFSVSDKVHIGADDWLFYRSTMDTEKVFSERLTQQQFDAFLGDLDALDRYLDSRGIELVVLPIPLKDAIYPEHLPSSTPRLPGHSRYQQLREWLAAHDSITTLDAYDFFAGKKEEGRVFHKTDFHWNDPTGFSYAEDLVNRLWEMHSGESEALWNKPLAVEEKSWSGGQANFLPLLRTPEEQGLFLGTGFEPGKGVHTYNAPTEFWAYVYQGNGDERGRLGGAVVMGDSFFDAMHRSGVDSYFASVHRSSAGPAGFSKVFKEIPEGTRYFIFEFIETMIFHYAISDLAVPDV